jgi:hypothetical protein
MEVSWICSNLSLWKVIKIIWIAYRIEVSAKYVLLTYKTTKNGQNNIGNFVI